MDTIEQNKISVEEAMEVCRKNNILCVEPRMSPTDRAEEAVTQIAFELGVMEGAIRAGGMLSEQKRQATGAIARRLLAAAGQS